MLLVPVPVLVLAPGLVVALDVVMVLLLLLQWWIPSPSL